MIAQTDPHRNNPNVKLQVGSGHPHPAFVTADRINMTAPHIRVLLNGRPDRRDRLQVSVEETSDTDDLYLFPHRVPEDDLWANHRVPAGALLLPEGEYALPGVLIPRDRNGVQIPLNVWAELVQDDRGRIGRDESGNVVIRLYATNVGGDGHTLSHDLFKVPGSDPARYVYKYNIFNFALVTGNTDGDASALYLEILREFNQFSFFSD